MFPVFAAGDDPGEGVVDGEVLGVADVEGDADDGAGVVGGAALDGDASGVDVGDGLRLAVGCAD
jgi:hypothetical protein